MNNVGEKINVEEIVKSCREMNLQELISLLKSDIIVFFSWGAERFTVDNQKRPRMFRMKVNGHHHKGHVYIFVNGLDLFEVYLITLQGIIKMKTEGEGLYFDQLVKWIDDRIERIPEYKY